MAQPRLRSERLRTFLKTVKGKTYTVGAITTLLVIIIFLIGVFPAISAILLQVEDNQSRITALSKIDTKRTTLRTLSNGLSTSSLAVTALNAVLPENLVQEDILNQLNGLANEYNLQLLNISFTDLDPRRNLSEVFLISNEALSGKNISINLQGGLNEIQSLLSDIENSRRIYNIKSFSVYRVLNQSGIESNLSQGYRIDIQAEMFFWNTSSDN